MKYHVILNGCSDTYTVCVKELKGFIQAYKGQLEEGNTILFYAAEQKKEDILSCVPTKNLILVKVERYQPELILQKLSKLFLAKEEALYLFASDYAGNELAVRLACRLGGTSLTSVQGFDYDGKNFFCHKMVYSNHMRGNFLLKKAPYCLSIAKGYPEADNKQEYQIIKEWDITNEKVPFIEQYSIKKEKKEEGLANAKLVLAVGRGVKSKEAVEELKNTAKLLKGELGISRPAAMSAWAPMKHLIGVSGNITKPVITITAGVSGAAAFYTGIEKSDFIVAINTDSKAPILKKADVSIIDDYKPILEELTKIIKLEQSAGEYK